MTTLKSLAYINAGLFELNNSKTLPLPIPAGERFIFYCFFAFVALIIF